MRERYASGEDKSMKKGRRGVGHFVPTSHKLGGVRTAQRSPFSRRQRGDGRIRCGGASARRIATRPGQEAGVSRGVLLS